MTYEEMKAKVEAQQSKEVKEEKECKFVTKMKEFSKTEEFEKFKEGARDGAIYAVGYAIGSRTSNKAIKTLFNFIERINGND